MGKSTEMLVAGREKRVNAGARMAQLLNNEDCDDFYKTTYGGFFDEANDDVYESPVESESDYVDSDFDIDENEPEPADAPNEVEAMDVEVEEELAKKKRLASKGYKEPVNKPHTPGAVGRPRGKTIKPPVTSRLSEIIEKKFRASTIRKSEEYERRREERGTHSRKYKRRDDQAVRLTQAELLEEAKETEKQNIKSLERFQQFEMEKKKRNRFGKQRQLKGMYIKYYSLAMPSVSTATQMKPLRSTLSPPPASENIHSTAARFYVGDDETNSSNSNLSAETQPSGEVDTGSSRSDSVDTTSTMQPTGDSKYARTFISFSDDNAYRLCFPWLGKPKPQRLKSDCCAVTGAPAKYKDPLTNLPYANAAAFKIIRDSYQKQIDERNRQDTKRPGQPQQPPLVQQQPL